MADRQSNPSQARRLLDRLNRSNHLLWLIGVCSFLETIIVPIPIEVVLIPLMAANRQRVWQLATATTVGCLLASLVGYGVGQLAFQSVGGWFIESMGYQQAYENFQAFFERHGFLAILLVGVLPIPFQVAMITAGLSGYPVALFALAAVIARGVRYYGLAWLVVRYGRQAADLWRRHSLLASVGAGAAVLVIVLGADYLAGRII